MGSDENVRPNAHQKKGPQPFSPGAAKSAAGSVAPSDCAQGGSGSVLTKPYSPAAATSDGPSGSGSGGSGSKRKLGLHTVSVYCTASEYGGGNESALELDFAGHKTLDEARAAVCKGLALPSSKAVAVQIVTLSGDAVTLDELQAPSEDLRLLLRIDGVLAKFVMPERVRSNLPVSPRSRT